MSVDDKEESKGTDFLASNFGYGQAKGGSAHHEQRDTELVQFLEMKIDSLRIHLQDLQEFFSKNQSDIGNGDQ